MTKLLDEYDCLFSQLEQINSDVNFFFEIKIVFLMASLSDTKHLQSSLASLNHQDDDKLTWENETSHPIEVWNQIQVSGSIDASQTGGGNKFAGRASDAPCTCCGRSNHNADKCCWNSQNPRNKIKELRKKLSRTHGTKKEKPDKETEKSSKKKSIEFSSAASGSNKSSIEGKLHFEFYERSKIKLIWRGSSDSRKE